MTNVFLVHGPPGTGKTTHLSRQAQRAAAEHSAQAVAVASLTRAAAAEIAGRDTGIPDENVGTLHATIYRALDRPKLAETPEGLRAWGAEHPALELTGGRSTLEDAPIESEAGSGRTRGDRLHSAIMCHRARATPVEQWADDERDYWTLWSDWCEQTRHLDFTSLIERALVELPAHPANPAVLLLDEAQDFSALELQLAQRWSQHTATTVVTGDTDQALYAWRGSDPKALLSMPRAGERVLTQSHRVPAAVHEMAMRWIGQLEHRADVAYRPTDVAGATRRLHASLRYPDPLIDAVAADLAAGRSVMVLAACSYMLSPVLKALRDAGLPFHNPHRVAAGQWNPMRAAGPLLAFLRHDPCVWGDRARLWSWDDLRKWMEPMTARGHLAHGTKAFIEAKCQKDRFGDSRADEVVPPEQVVELLGAGPSAWTEHPAVRGDMRWWADTLRAGEAKRLRYLLNLIERTGLGPLTEMVDVLDGTRAATDLQWVTAGTIHSVKGGEADSVYVFPDLSRAGMWDGWQPGGPGRDGIVRMIYVALTRTRETVTILDPSGPEHAPLDLLGDGARAPEHVRLALGPTFGRAA